jgi:AcrR family transcriptional regulator
MLGSVGSDNKAVNDNKADGVHIGRYRVLPPMAYHHGNLRAELIDAGQRALEDGGVAALSLRGLARELGVSHAAPGRHFADKQALLDALAENGYAQLGAVLGEALATTGPAFDDRLLGLACAYVAFATAHPALLELMFTAKHADGPRAVQLRTSADAALAAPLQLIATAQAAGEVVPGDPERIGVTAWAAIHGIASMASTGMLTEFPLDELVEETVRRAILGLRPRPG